MEVNAFLLVLSSYLLLLPINLRLFLGFGTFLIVGYGVCTYHTRTTEEEASAEENRNFLEQFEAREKERIRAQQEREDAYVKLARHTIETYLRTGKRPSVPEGLPEELYRRQAGAFVSLKKDGRLRGCIGTIQAVQNSLAEEIIRNDVSACSEDPRFPPVEQQIAIAKQKAGIKKHETVEIGRAHV